MQARRTRRASTRVRAMQRDRTKRRRSGVRALPTTQHRKSCETAAEQREGRGFGDGRLRAAALVAATITAAAATTARIVACIAGRRRLAAAAAVDRWDARSIAAEQGVVTRPRAGCRRQERCKQSRRGDRAEVAAHRPSPWLLLLGTGRVRSHRTARAGRGTSIRTAWAPAQGFVRASSITQKQHLAMYCHAPTGERESGSLPVDSFDPLPGKPRSARSCPDLNVECRLWPMPSRNAVKNWPR